MLYPPNTLRTLWEAAENLQFNVLEEVEAGEAM